MPGRPLDFRHPPPPAAPAPATTPVATPPVLPRAAVLLGLLVTLDLWCSHHLGVGLATRPVWLGVVMASWLGAFSVLQKLLDEEEAKALSSRLTGGLAAGARRLLRSFLLATPVLVGLGIVLVVLVLGYSSITVDSAVPLAPADVRLVPVDAGTVAGTVTAGGERRPARGDVILAGRAPLRYLVRTGPAARSFQLTLPGYLPTVVTVPVLTGLRVTPADDLHVVPLLLLRPPPSALASLENGGTIEVWSGEGPARRQVTSDSCRCQASYVLGGMQAVPADAGTRWQLELTMLRGAAPQSAPFSRALLAWGKPRRLTARGPFPPRAPITVLVKSRAGKTVARSGVPITLGDEPFVDVLLEGNHDDTP